MMRGYYGFEPEAISSVFAHLLSLTHIQIEDRPQIETALSHYEAGLDFADALHHAAYAGCDAMASFDDRRFARRVKKLALIPNVMIPR